MFKEKVNPFFESVKFFSYKSLVFSTNGKTLQLDAYGDAERPQYSRQWSGHGTKRSYNVCKERIRISRKRIRTEFIGNDSLLLLLVNGSSGSRKRMPMRHLVI